MFDNGVAVDRIIGFEELGGEDDFNTLTLTRRLIRGGVLEAKNKKEKGQIKINKGSGRGIGRNDSSDEEY